MSGNSQKILVSVLAIGMTVTGAGASQLPDAAIASGPAIHGGVISAPRASGALLVAQATPAAASPYTWSATKAADGYVALSGHVPSQEVRGSLTDGIPKVGTDSTTIASGEPDGFVDDAVAALTVLGDLDTGSVAFDGTNWSVTGVVDSAEKAKDAQAAFDASPLKALGATYEVTAPVAEAPAPAAAATTPAPAEATPPAAAATAAPDYAWSAEKAVDGTITFAGSVPTDILKGFLKNHVPGKAVDNTTVLAGAPKDFVGGALYGLNALMGLESGKLAFTGGKWTLSGAAKDEAAGKLAKGALSVIDTKDWAFDIAVAPAAAAAAPAAAPAPAEPAKPAAAAAPAAPAYVFSARKAAGGAVVLSGDVPTDGAKGYVGDIAGNVPTDGLAVVPDAPADFITNVLGGLDLLAKLGEGELKLEGGKWSLTGKAPTPEGRDAVVAALAKLPAAKDFVAADIAGPTPLEQCTAKLAEVRAKGGNAINFEGRTSKFVKGTDAALDAVAAALALCPEQRVDVEGNTDSDGAANANMALSVARAEAVIDALVKRGLKQDRLYAVGYGETLPLVPNTTKANKAKNRRIEFKIVN
jgi:outer membrane protein OmpA-like peptidoglycan-associated protein